jgi:hypothetical protein
MVTQSKSPPLCDAPTTFSVLLLKGLVEQNNAKHWLTGSLCFDLHLQDVVDLGLVDTTTGVAQLTERGQRWYDHAGLATIGDGNMHGLEINWAELWNTFNG